MNSPIMANVSARRGPKRSERSLKNGMTFSTTNDARRSKMGRSTSPIVSLMCPNAAPILKDEVTVAAAVPPTCFSIAARTSSCASPILFDSISVAMRSFSASVNVTPDFASAVMPLIGSWSALPSWMAFVSADPNPAAARSTAAVVARSNCPPSSFALLPSSLKVRSFACVALMVSAVTPNSNSCASASFCSRVVTAAVDSPKRFIDLFTAARRSSATRAASAPLMALTANAPAAAPAAANPRAATLPILPTDEPNFPRAVSDSLSDFLSGAALPEIVTEMSAISCASCRLGRIS